MIPDVNYKAQNSHDYGVEIIELDSIYKRVLADHDPSKPHRLHFNALILITEGSGSHFVDFHRYRVRKGDLIYVSQNQIHAFDFNGKPSGSMLLFNSSYLEQLRTEVRLPILSPHYVDTSGVPIFTPSPELTRSSGVLLNEIRAALEAKGSMASIKLLTAALLINVLTARPNMISHSTNLHHFKTFTSFIMLVEDHFTETREAAAYADMMHVTYKTLNDLCKRCCGKTAKQVIDSHTVLEAKRRLAIEHTRVEQLTYDLGFDEATNFVKYFKKHAAMTPAHFKKQFES